MGIDGAIYRNGVAVCKNTALLADSGDVLLNGVEVANVPIQTAWLEITGTTLYVYSIVVSPARPQRGPSALSR